jgi:hypothetical protein
MGMTIDTGVAEASVTSTSISAFAKANFFKRLPRKKGLQNREMKNSIINDTQQTIVIASIYKVKTIRLVLNV